MRFDKNKILSLLQTRINYCNVITAFIFGSIANKGKTPRDCDVYIVTNSIPFTPEWISLKKEIERLKIDFEKEFELPLNIIFDTEKEFSERSFLSSSIISKPIIKIK